MCLITVASAELEQQEQHQRRRCSHRSVSAMRNAMMPISRHVLDIYSNGWPDFGHTSQRPATGMRQASKMLQPIAPPTAKHSLLQFPFVKLWRWCGRLSYPFGSWPSELALQQVQPIGLKCSSQSDTDPAEQSPNNFSSLDRLNTGKRLYTTTIMLAHVHNTRNYTYYKR